MHRSIMPAMIIASLLAGAGFAAASTDTGRIKKIDSRKGAIELVDGKWFSLPRSIDAATFRTSERVAIDYRGRVGRSVAVLSGGNAICQPSERDWSPCGTGFSDLPHAAVRIHHEHHHSGHH